MKRGSFAGLAVVAFSFFCLIVAVYADVPPEPGFKRVSQNLILEAGDEMPEYRFFVKSGADLKELVLKKGEKVTVEPLGGGAWYRAGTLIAVPGKSLDGLNGARANGKLSELQKAVYDGKAAGAIELLRHSFVREVREAEAREQKDALYQIKKDGEKGLKATLVSDIADPDPGHSSGNTFYSREEKTSLFWTTVAGGSFLTLALIGLGVWLVRRPRTKAIQ